MPIVGDCDASSEGVEGASDGEEVRSRNESRRASCESICSTGTASTAMESSVAEDAHLPLQNADTDGGDVAAGPQGIVTVMPQLPWDLDDDHLAFCHEVLRQRVLHILARKKHLTSDQLLDKFRPQLDAAADRASAWKLFKAIVHAHTETVLFRGARSLCLKQGAEEGLDSGLNFKVLAQPRMLDGSRRLSQGLPRTNGPPRSSDPTMCMRCKSQARAVRLPCGHRTVCAVCAACLLSATQSHCPTCSAPTVDQPIYAASIASATNTASSARQQTRSTNRGWARNTVSRVQNAAAMPNGQYNVSGTTDGKTPLRKKILIGGALVLASPLIVAGAALFCVGMTTRCCWQCRCGYRAEEWFDSVFQPPDYQ
eukprot:m.306731 g.306731  ORF g.306731 m.306731 type:complete len:369 (+) comp19242_c0_seq1:70-1176(+)